MKKLLCLLCILFSTSALTAQTPTNHEYFLQQYEPYISNIPTPEEFLGYPIGDWHTRHDRIVAYFEKLAELSDRVEMATYGKTYELRPLVMLTVTSADNLQNLESLKAQHLEYSDPTKSPSNYDALPAFIQLGYNVHGNEASSSEAALLTAYTLAASENPLIQNYLRDGIIFIDPAINPDGRDRHTQWVNQHRASPVVADVNDAVHQESWPQGRTNHYWFDLNRDWLLAVHPESRGKLAWYHDWYPNVVTDFHEMGSNSNYFFEPMKPIGSKDPIMPRENYEDLNNLFAKYFSNSLDSIGSFYYTKESFDGTYPGYGSSYPDLQGALALLFEQARSRGQVVENDFGEMTFAFTIRNQYVSSMATIQAAVENKSYLREYQQRFFKSALDWSGVGAYRFGDPTDKNRTAAFVEFLRRHKIRVYKDGDRYLAPLKQPQRRMVQTMFETYREYRDSVYYDASAWSVANFYNMPYEEVAKVSLGEEVVETNAMVSSSEISQANYAYLVDWRDYNAPAALHYLQSEGVQVTSAFKPFSIQTGSGDVAFGYGTLMIPVSRQNMDGAALFEIMKQAKTKFNVPVYSTNGGFSSTGIDLGSNFFSKVDPPRVLLVIGEGGGSYVNSYEAGEVWHLLDQRVHMPITRVRLNRLSGTNLNRYNTIVMVSGRYAMDSVQQAGLSNWVSKGNTLITIGSATSWAVKQNLVSESLVEAPKDSTVKRLPFVTAPENNGKNQIGGIILKSNLDISHPLAFGYTREDIPVYKNNNVFLKPSKNAYATVSKYTEDPHIDGFVTEKNYTHLIKPSASLVVSKLGGGRVILFADNPNFRGAWYGTNRLFLNAIFLGNQVYVPGNGQ